MMSQNKNNHHPHTHEATNADAHDGHDHGTAGEGTILSNHWELLSALAILAAMLVLEFGFHYTFSHTTSLIIYGIAYLLAGYKVLDLAFRKMLRGDIFNEFFLMSAATIGAFLIGAYSEGVAVMVFYSIGEWFQDAAVNKAKRSIKALLDIRPDKVTVLRDGAAKNVQASEVALKEVIRLKAGEKLALDGKLLSDSGIFNTAALTGEATPDRKTKGATVYAGMINLQNVIEVEVNTLFKDSKLSRILEMVQDATARKSQTQLFISKFAKVYTPIVFFLALLVVGLPWFFAEDYQFSTWFYRALVFLVISCPCALVVSIPLGYFGGIGLASRHGILFKGGNFLDLMQKINMVVFDKTGTLTRGVFKVQEIVPEGMDQETLLQYAVGIEKNSTHPIAVAIAGYAGDKKSAEAKNVSEIAGHGLKGTVEGKEILAGNTRLLDKYKVQYPAALKEITDTIVVLAVDKVYAGYITIADELKEDAPGAIDSLNKLNIKTIMLSGDKQLVVEAVAKKLNVSAAWGGLLPEDKVAKVDELKKQGYTLAFAGDGVNDAPVVALADAGIAMGGLGSDATIETADIVIQNDQPSKIITAIKIGKITRKIVWQNIILAMGVKIIVLALGAGGVATLWEAVIADVGVALLAILNAVRIQKIKSL